MKKNFLIIGLAVLIISGCDLGELSDKPIAPLVFARARLDSLSIEVTWNKVSNADSYDVYFETDTDSDLKNLGNTTETSYIHEDLNPETTYYYYVKAKNSNGTSGFSIRTLPTKPLEFENKPRAPIWVIATAKGNLTIEVRWDKVSSATSFEVYYEEGSADKQKIDTIDVTADTEALYTHTNLSADKTYTYYVKSINSNGESDFSRKSNPAKPNETVSGGTSPEDAIAITADGVTGTLLTSLSERWYKFTGNGQQGTLKAKDYASGEYSANILADIYTTPPSAGVNAVYAKINNQDADAVDLGRTNYESITQIWSSGTTYYVKVYPYPGSYLNTGTFWLSFE